MLRVLAAAAIALLSGCATAGSDVELPDYVRHPRTAYQIEGEVRDEVTFAPMPGAEVVVETDRAGYLAMGRADAGGRFSIGYSAALEFETGVWPIWFAPVADSTLIDTIRVRATRGGRCSPTQRFALKDMPESGLVLLVGDCSRYRRDRASTPQRSAPRSAPDGAAGLGFEGGGGRSASVHGERRDKIGLRDEIARSRARDRVADCELPSTVRECP